MATSTRDGSYSAYAERDIVLRGLGYSSYAAYLASDLWNGIRKKAMRANDYQCFICRQKADDVHHTDYSKDTLLGKNLNALVPLCRTCHGLGEFSVGGHKRTLEEANRRLGLLFNFSSLNSTAVAEVAPKWAENGLCTYREVLVKGKVRRLWRFPCGHEFVKRKTPTRCSTCWAASERNRLDKEKRKKKDKVKADLMPHCPKCGKIMGFGRTLCRPCSGDGIPT